VPISELLDEDEDKKAEKKTMQRRRRSGEVIKRYWGNGVAVSGVGGGPGNWCRSWSRKYLIQIMCK